MKLKKLTAVLCAAAICLAMSACSSDSNTASETVSDTSISETTTTASDAVSEAPEASDTNAESDSEEKDNPAKRMIKFDLPEGFASKGESFNELAYGDGVANIILKCNYNEEGFPPVKEFEETGRMMNMFLYSSFEVEYSDAIYFTLGGYDAAESTFFVYDAENKDQGAKYRSVYVETETCAYILTLGSLEKDFDNYVEIFNKVIDSVEFIKE